MNLPSWSSVWLALCWLAMAATLGGCQRAASPGPDLLPDAATSETAFVPQCERRASLLDDLFDRVDPRSDAYPSETFHDEASAQLDRLAKLARLPQEQWPGELASLIHPQAAGALLRPSALDEVYRDARMVVRRPVETRDGGAGRGGDSADASGARENVPSRDHASPREIGWRGVDEFAQSLAALAHVWPADGQPRGKFKIVRVQLDGDRARTQAHAQWSADSPTMPVQQTSYWTCRWSNEHPPRLLALEVERFEEVACHGPQGPMLVDCTASVLGDCACWERQLLRGTDQWRRAIDRTLGQEAAGLYGITVADFDGDGLDDVYLPQAGGVPNRLFLQQPDGTCRDASAESGLDLLDLTRAALAVDLDNDGDQDLVLAVSYGVAVLENTGKGKFIKRKYLRFPSDPYSLCAADIDNDGDLDVYCCLYMPDGGLVRDGANTLPLPYHDANNGAPNILLRNEGNWKFVDATAAVGLNMNNRKFSLAASFEDYDNDGDLDLFVANDFGRKNLYRNDGGRFVDVAAAAGVEDPGAGMSVSWGDVNGDGLVDLYVANMFSSAGNRIATQQKFLTHASADDRGTFLRHARGNSLFLNNGDGTFRDVSTSCGAMLGRWAWSSLFVDLNNDGRQDIFVANGFITQEDSGDL